MNLLDELKYRFKYSDPVVKLIIINTFVFLTCVFIHLFLWLFNGSAAQDNFLYNALALPSSANKALSHVWTTVTYQFTHFKLFHFLFNMIVLHLAGAIFMDYFKKKELWTVYILGGLSAGLLYIMGASFLPGLRNLGESHLLGASASVMAVLFAATTYAPNVRLTLFRLFEIKLIWFSLFFLLIDLVSMPISNSGGHIAHIGGVIVGWMYAWYRKNKYQFKVESVHKETKVNSRHLKVEMNENRKTTSASVNSTTNVNRVPTQEEVDAILDKISQSGYDRLSKEEKEILFKASQE